MKNARISWKKPIEFTFPIIKLNIIYKMEEYAQLRKKFEEKSRKKISNKAFIICLDSCCIIYINFQSHFEGKSTTNFVIDLSLSYLEELVHIIYPNKKHTEICDLICSTIEKFLGIELPDEYRQTFLREVSDS